MDIKELIHAHNEYFKVDFLMQELAKEKDFTTVASIFSLLSDSSRLKIFWFLCHSKDCVINIAQVMGMTTPAVSHHLKLLKESGLIDSSRDGKEVFYFASSTSKVHVLHQIIEKLMEVTCPDFDSEHEKINENSEYLKEQIETVKKVHDYLTENLSKRITIDELSKNFGMNTTTLKTVFKDVYGSSLASHIKSHRMEKAAQLLVKTDLSINEVACNVGYESQSKFSAVFKEYFNLTPIEYKKKNT